MNQQAAHKRAVKWTRSAKRFSTYCVAALLVAAAFFLPHVCFPHWDPAPEMASINSSLQRQFRAQQTEEGTNIRKFVLQQKFSPEQQDGAVDTSASSSAWQTLSFGEVSDLWQSSTTFTEVFTTSLASAPFDAFFWESVPVTKGTMDKAYEYVLVDSPFLASVSANGDPFAKHLTTGDGTTDVVSFRNIGADALLIAPCRAEEREDTYAHIAAFVREAPREQIIKLWDAVGAEMKTEIASRDDESPLWLSTSGAGVYWLHVRFDSYPKYYTYKPFASGER